MKIKGSEEIQFDAAKKKLGELFDEVFGHDGYGSIEVDMKILRRGQKEVILRCGKEYRFILDFPQRKQLSHAGGATRLVSTICRSEDGE